MAETSAHELLDIVDLNDVVVGSKSRGEIHRLGLPHRSVHVLVFNEAAQLLLQKRSMLKDECAGMWDSSCAGHVEAGQSYGDTTVREIDEELGIKLGSEPEFLFKMAPTSGNGMEFASVYRVVYGGPFVVAADEIDEVKWFSVGQLDSWVSSSTGTDTSINTSTNTSTNTNDGDLTTGFCEIWLRYRELHP